MVVENRRHRVPANKFDRSFVSPLALLGAAGASALFAAAIGTLCCVAARRAAVAGRAIALRKKSPGMIFLAEKD